MPRIRFLHPRDLFRRAFGHNAAAAGAAFRTQIDNPVGGAHHIRIVFDHQQRTAVLNQLLQRFQQAGNIVEMKTGGGFVANEERAFIGRLRQMGGQFHALGLTP